MTANLLIPVAQFVRMSAERQQYSLNPANGDFKGILQLAYKLPNAVSTPTRGWVISRRASGRFSTCSSSPRVNS